MRYHFDVQTVNDGVIKCRKPRDEQEIAAEEAYWGRRAMEAKRLASKDSASTDHQHCGTDVSNERCDHSTGPGLIHDQHSDRTFQFS